MSKETRRQELWEQAEDIIAENGPRDAMLDKVESLYFDPDTPVSQNEEQQKDDEIIEIVKMPWASNVIELIQDMMARAGYSIAAAAASSKTRHQALAEQTERLLKSVINQSQEHQGQDFLGVLAWTVAIRGAVAGRVQMFLDWMEQTAARDDPWTMQQFLTCKIEIRDQTHVHP